MKGVRFFSFLAWICTTLSPWAIEPMNFSFCKRSWKKNFKKVVGKLRDYHKLDFFKNSNGPNLNIAQPPISKVAFQKLQLPTFFWNWSFITIFLMCNKKFDKISMGKEKSTILHFQGLNLTILKKEHFDASFEGPQMKGVRFFSFLAWICTTLSPWAIEPMNFSFCKRSWKKNFKKVVGKLRDYHKLDFFKNSNGPNLNMAKPPISKVAFQKLQLPTFFWNWSFITIFLMCNKKFDKISTGKEKSTILHFQGLNLTLLKKEHFDASFEGPQMKGVRFFSFLAWICTTLSPWAIEPMNFSFCKRSWKKNFKKVVGKLRDYHKLDFFKNSNGPNLNMAQPPISKVAFQKLQLPTFFWNWSFITIFLMCNKKFDKISTGKEKSTILHFQGLNLTILKKEHFDSPFECPQMKGVRFFSFLAWICTTLSPWAIEPMNFSFCKRSWKKNFKKVVGKLRDYHKLDFFKNSNGPNLNMAQPPISKVAFQKLQLPTFFWNWSFITIFLMCNKKFDKISTGKEKSTILHFQGLNLTILKKEHFDLSIWWSSNEGGQIF